MYGKASAKTLTRLVWSAAERLLRAETDMISCPFQSNGTWLHLRYLWAEYCPTDSTCGDARGLKVTIVEDGKHRLVPWEIAMMGYPMPEETQEDAELEMEAVELLEDYQPDLEIQRLIAESLGEFNKTVNSNLDDIHNQSQ